MALSKKTQLVLIQETNKPLAAAIQFAVDNRAALSAKNSVQLASYMASPYKGKAKKQSDADEVLAALVSGAALSLNSKRKLITMMANAAAGNELINYIQSSPTPNIKL